MIALPLLLSADVLTGQEVTIFYKWRLSQQRGVTFLGGGVTAFTGREVYVLGGVLTVLTGRELTVLGEVVTVVTDREVAVLGGVVFDRDGSHCRRTGGDSLHRPGDDSLGRARIDEVPSRRRTSC